MKYIHVAGTNGKGSTSEFISSIIMASGASCGCFTSPHLFSPVERFRLNGKCIDENTLNDLMEYVEKKNLAVNETLFAKYTAAAFEWYKTTNPDYVVLETGLGGKYDPTNVTGDKLAVLTSISLDHMQYLGEDIKDIAAEKCGIIKEGNTVISSSQTDEVKTVIVKESRKKNADLTFAEIPKIISTSLKGQTFQYKGEEYSIKALGKYQLLNSAIAIECAIKLGISSDSIKKGLLNTRIKARAQYVPGNPPMFIDGAHNPGAMSMLIDTLKTHFSNKEKVLLFGCMQDKDYHKMIDLMAGEFLEAVIVSADIQRGADVHELQRLFSTHTPAKAELDIPSGLAAAKEAAINKDALLVVCGSFYLAGSKYIQDI